MIDHMDMGWDIDPFLNQMRSKLSLLLLFTEM